MFFEGDEMMSMVKGVVKGQTVILPRGSKFEDGCEVLVTSRVAGAGSPQAILEAIRSEPHLSSDEVAEFEKIIESGKKPVSFRSPLVEKLSKKRK
jgi:hypothetical protein